MLNNSHSVIPDVAGKQPMRLVPSHQPTDVYNCRPVFIIWQTSSCWHL